MNKKHKRALKEAQKHMNAAAQSLLNAAMVIDSMAKPSKKLTREIACYSSVTFSDLLDLANSAVNHHEVMGNIRTGKGEIVIKNEEAMH